MLCVLCGYYGISLLMEQKDQQANLFLMKEIAVKTEQKDQLEQTNRIEQTEAVRQTELPADQNYELDDEVMPEMPQKIVKENSEQNLKACPIDFTALQEKYPDVYAWITVPGTKVDYAIVQHQTEDEFYLNHGYQQDYTAYGAIYSEKENHKDFSDPVTVLYGHNMKDGTMFASLHQFEDQSFFDEHREFTIYTPKASYTYRIFAAHVFPSAHLMKKYDLPKLSGMERYLKDIYSIRSMTDFVIKEPEVTTGDKIVTLSTCKGMDHSIRYLVQGVLTDTEFYTPD